VIPERRSASGAIPAGAAAVVGLTAFALLVAGFFVGSFGGEFAGLYDSLLLGHENRLGFGDGRFAWVFEATRGEMRRPLFWLALAVEQALTDRPAAAIHVASGLLHLTTFVGAAGLAAGLARGARDRWTVLLVVTPLTVWFLHPLRVEPVACASQQGTVLGGALIAAAAACWLRGVGRSRGGFVTAIALVALALLADPALCFAPVALLALTFWVGRDNDVPPTPARRALTLTWIASALCLVATFACREPGGGASALPSALAAASAIVRPLRATLWPVGLHPGYDAPQGFPTELAPSLWIDAVTAAALVAACIWGVRRRHGLGLALLAYLGLAAGPALLRREPFGADGDAYVATLPLFVAAGVALARAADGVGRSRPIIAVAVFVAASVPVLALTRGRADAWRDEATLAKSVVDADPTNERAYVAMGDEARRAGAPVADLVHWYATALEYGEWRPLAHARLGAALLETGDTPGARRHLERAVEIAPWLAPARFDLGALELRQGHLDAARTQLLAAARLDSESADAWRLVAQTMDAGGDREGAANAIGRAARLRPDDAAIAEELRRLTK
jgi:hypothetical protein